jgi:hypothetical protein
MSERMSLTPHIINALYYEDKASSDFSRPIVVVYEGVYMNDNTPSTIPAVEHYSVINVCKAPNEWTDFDMAIVDSSNRLKGRINEGQAQVLACLFGKYQVFYD